MLLVVRWRERGNVVNCEVSCHVMWCDVTSWCDVAGVLSCLVMWCNVMRCALTSYAGMACHAMWLCDVANWKMACTVNYGEPMLQHACGSVLQSTTLRPPNMLYARLTPGPKLNQLASTAIKGSQKRVVLVSSKSSIATHSKRAASALSVLMSVALRSWNCAPLNLTSNTRHLKLQYPNTSPGPSGAGSSTEWQAHKNVALKCGSTIAMTHWNVRCLQRSRFVK